MEGKLPDPSGHRVIILSGGYAGQEGVCLGPATGGSQWMISPDESNEIVAMEFDREFGILVTGDN